MKVCQYFREEILNYDSLSTSEYKEYMDLTFAELKMCTSKPNVLLDLVGSIYVKYFTIYNDSMLVVTISIIARSGKF